MQYSYYVYEKLESDFKLNKMPIWFREVNFEGDENKGIIFLETQNEFDELWGPIAKMEISWEKKDRLKYFHAKEVQRSIDAFNAIKIVVTVTLATK